jgi:hypothetical protein
MEVKALHDELENIKHENDLAADDEGTNGESWEESLGEAVGPWSKVIDPDTGEVFYWNEETEEMRWEL